MGGNTDAVVAAYHQAHAGFAQLFAYDDPFGILIDGPKIDFTIIK